MSWTLCTSGAAINKAGAQANTTIVASGAALAQWSDEAESYACDVARYDIITNYGSLTTAGKYIFQDLASSLVAQKIINYEPEAIGKNGAALRLNVLENNISKAVNLIKEDKVKTYLAIT